MKEMGSGQLVIRVPAFQAGLRFTCLLTWQTGALECSPGTPALQISESAGVSEATAGPPKGTKLPGGTGWRQY